MAGTAADNDATDALRATPYRFVSILGSGGTSTVIAAEHVGLGRPVVIKLLDAELDARADLAERLRVEAQTLARLDHPNLVKVLDFGRTPSGRSYLAMERVEGRSLAEEVQARGALPTIEVIEIVQQLLSALGAAHAAGVVHRDVKPANLLFCRTAEGRTSIKLVDFGIAKLLPDRALDSVGPVPTRDGVRLGTPRYVAPEQLRGGIVSPATDVYAVGHVLYELLVGQHAFAHATTVDDLHRAQLVEMPRRPSQATTRPIPELLDRAVMRALAKAPADRYPTAATFSEELDRVRAALASPSGLAAGSTSSVQSRNAPTLTSDAQPTRAAPEPATTDAPTLAAARARTLAVEAPTLRAELDSPLARRPTGAPAPTVDAGLLAPTPAGTGTLISGSALGSDPAAPTARFGSAPAPQPMPTSSASATPDTPALGAACTVLGLVFIVVRLIGLVSETVTLVDPVKTVEGIRGTSAGSAAADVALWARAASAIESVRLLVLALIGLGLLAAGIKLLLHRAGAPSAARQIAGWGLGAAALTGLTDVALVTPLRAHALGLVAAVDGPGIDDTAVLALNLFGALMVALAQLALLLALRLWAARVERASIAAGGRAI